MNLLAASRESGEEERRAALRAHGSPYTVLMYWLHGCEKIGKQGSQPRTKSTKFYMWMPLFLHLCIKLGTQTQIPMLVCWFCFSSSPFILSTVLITTFPHILAFIWSSSCKNTKKTIGIGIACKWRRPTPMTRLARLLIKCWEQLLLVILPERSFQNE